MVIKDGSLGVKIIPAWFPVISSRRKWFGNSSQAKHAYDMSHFTLS